MIYFVEAVGIGRIKIGYTQNRATLANRLAALAAQAPTRMKLLGSAQGGIEVERSLHKAFRRHREVGEWFLANPRLIDLASNLAGVDEKAAAFLVQKAIAEEDQEARLAESSNQTSDAIDVGLLSKEAVSKFVTKHGIATSAKISGASQDSVRNWRDLISTPRFYHIVPLIRFDPKPFAGTPFFPIQPSAQAPTANERIERIERDLEAIRKELAA